MEHLPPYISIVFMLTTFFALFLLYRAVKSYLIILIAAGWLGLQGIISSTGFYTVTNTVPPRFVLTVFPPLVLIIVLFTTNRGRQFIDGLDAKALTLVHIVRIPVEIVLLWLSIQKFVPLIMTFEGSNFDIISGITAPLIYYFGFVRKRLSNGFLLVWNLVCLALLINIVSIAILSAPFAFQKFAFEQPNIAVLYFPFVWLPAFIVPVVLFSHLVAIRQLVMQRKMKLKLVMQ
jgi:hypothetical protein